MSLITKIAIDPGYSGAIAKEDINGNISVDKMPSTMYDIFNYFRHEIDVEPQTRCMIEKVGAMPGNGVKAMWTFSENATTIKLSLYSCSIGFDEVTPKKWMSQLGTTIPKDKKDRKNKIKMLMQQKYPHIKTTLWNADALAMLSVM